MKYISSASVLALMVAGTPALADVTPQQVWENLEGYMKQFGYDVTATETMDGKTLTVSDISMNFVVPDDGGAFALTMDSMTLTDQGDGTVLVGMAEEVPMSMKGMHNGEDVMDMKMVMGQKGMNMVVSGEPGNMTYDYSADQLSARIDSLIADGEDMSGDDFKMTFAMKGVTGKSAISTTADAQTVAQEMAAETAEFDVAVTEPDGGDTVTFKGVYQSVVGTGDTTIPSNVDMSNPMNLMSSGLAGISKMSHSGGAAEFAVTGPDAASGSTTSASGSIEVSFSQDGLRYKVGGTDTKASMNGPMPFPLSMAMEKSGFELMIPTKANDGPQDAKLSVLLGGFTMDDMLWMMVDAGNVLPRDPATIALDLDAKVTPFLNIFDPKDAEKLESGEAMPGEVNEVTLTNLLVEAIGGKIMGTGAFTFDNSDLESFDGMPRPQGQVNLRAEGVNGVMDKLVEMGLLSATDVGGARMMLVMFSVPGETEDSLSSVIEINEEGHVLANGQRIK